MFKKRNKVNFYNRNLSKPIFDKYIFIESLLGSNLESELLFATKEILKKYDHKIVIVTKNPRNIKQKIDFSKYKDRIILIKPKTYAYSYYLARCKYLLNDTTFKWYFKKRNEQVYFNTWHGIPIKVLGRYIRVSKLHSIINIKKNFEFADNIIVNSDYLKRMLKGSYMLNNNAKFIERKFYKYSNQNLNSTNKGLVVSFFYTWLEGKYQSDKFWDKIKYIDNVIKNHKSREKEDKFIISLHHFASNKKIIKKIKKELDIIEIIPENMSSYELIDLSDTIVTDYSSILFDASFKKKNIVLDWSNEPEYEKTRGIIGEFRRNNKFETFYNIRDSIDAIFNPKSISKESLNEFNKYFLDIEMKKEKYWLEDFINYKKETNEKNNIENRILFYPGRLSINGLTSSAISTIETLLSKGKKITIWIPHSIMNINLLKKVGLLDNENVELLLTAGESQDKTFLEKIGLFLVKRNIYTPSFLYKKVETYYKKEKDKIFGDSYFSKVIHFTGYEIMVAEIFKHINTDEKIIYVHNDMIMEYKKRRNFKRKSIFSAYYKFDKIICVSEYLKNSLIKKSKVFKKNSHKFHYLNNPLSEKIFEINRENTTIEKPFIGDFEVFKSKLFDKDCFKIVNIGRFSKEKNQKFLIREYVKFRKNNKESNSILILIGSQRKLNKRYYNSLKRIIKRSRYSNDIYGFENINVFSILSYSNLFVLASTHEGFPIATLEAYFTGVNILFTKLPGNIEQNEKYGVGKIFNINNSNEFQENLDWYLNAKEIDKNVNNNNKFDLISYNNKIKEDLKKVYERSL